MAPSIFWFRRDLRVVDNPALVYAATLGDGDVLPVFVVDDAFATASGPNRARYLRSTLDALNQDVNGALVVRGGDPAIVLLALAQESGATDVVATTDYGPRGRQRDERVAHQLAQANVRLHFVDSPYLVMPGTVVTKTGTPCKVFTAFRRGWELEPIPAPMAAPTCRYVRAEGDETSLVERRAGLNKPDYFGDLGDVSANLPAAGTPAALALLDDFARHADAYGDERNTPGIEGTSRLSPHLRFGTVHPRQVVSRVGAHSEGRATFVSEICWREFYADVLWHHPDSTWQNLQPTFDHLEIDRGPAAVEKFQRWARGETGYPFVDAGMRQLLAEGWMHNRVRMITASFLVKHLHLDWRWGAKWFMWHLIDGDVASNQHGWQWAAGTGTDAAPFHRVFNPTLQAERFDPTGAYIHRWVPELATTAAPECLQPGGGSGLLRPAAYPSPMVEANAERDEALARFQRARAASKLEQ
jgi:deoxyribodipyrimidine photo-lyase